jgi:RHS repeat-associated protein
VEVSGPDGEVTLAYDALGFPSAITTPDGTHTLLVDDSTGLPRPVEVVAPDGAVTTFAHAGYAPLASVSGGVASYFVLGPDTSPVLRLSASGVVEEAYETDAWGWASGVPPPASVEPGLHGGTRLPGLELVWLGERFYDPSMGQFLSRDPALMVSDDPLRLHPYAYAGNAPSWRADPTGLTFSIGGLMVSISISIQMRAYQAGAVIGAGAAAISRLLMRINVSAADRFWRLARMNVGGPRAWWHAIRQFGTNLQGWRNAGPLPQRVIDTFRNLYYRSINLNQDIYVFRYHDHGVKASETGGYMSAQLLRSPEAIRRAMAILPRWNNLTHVTVYRIPSGTQIFFGRTAEQGRYAGGGYQILINGWQSMSEAAKLAWKVGEMAL